jgi:hypothetical protein
VGLEFFVWARVAGIRAAGLARCGPNKSIAQQALFKRARLNSAATLGHYTAAMENE